MVFLILSEPSLNFCCALPRSPVLLENWEMNVSLSSLPCLLCFLRSFLRSGCFEVMFATNNSVQCELYTIAHTFHCEFYTIALLADWRCLVSHIVHGLSFFWTFLRTQSQFQNSCRRSLLKILWQQRFRYNQCSMFNNNPLINLYVRSTSDKICRSIYHEILTWGSKESTLLSGLIELSWDQR